MGDQYQAKVKNSTFHPSKDKTTKNMKSVVQMVIKNDGKFGIAKAGNVVNVCSDASFIGMGNYTESRYINSKSYKSQISLYKSLIPAFDITLSLHSPQITEFGDAIFSDEGRL